MTCICAVDEALPWIRRPTDTVETHEVEVATEFQVSQVNQPPPGSERSFSPWRSSFQSEYLSLKYIICVLRVIINNSKMTKLLYNMSGYIWRINFTHMGVWKMSGNTQTYVFYEMNIQILYMAMTPPVALLA